MLESEFAAINWVSLDEATFQKYVGGEAVDGKSLTIKQRGAARAARSGTTLGFSVAPIAVNPDDTKYQDMARPDDPAFAVFARNFETGNFWYWFGTFWKEMPKEHRLTVLRRIVTADGGLQLAFAHFDRKNADTMSTTQQDDLRRLLKDDMMDKGFTPWKLKAKKADELEASPKKGSSLLPTIDALGKQIHSVGFRGDTRDPDTLASHDNGAFVPKAQSPYQIGKYNLDKRWHPFFDAQVRNTMYWREGQADNDLFTVVSIAKDVATSTKFPLLNDAPPDLNVIPNGAKVTVLNKLKQKETKQLTVSTMYSYMVIADEGYNTEEFQKSKFPEIGVAKIPAENFLASLDVLRIHFGPDGDDGHIVFISDYKINRPHHRKQLYLQDPSAEMLIQFLNYLADTYYHKFFVYQTVNSPTLLKIDACQGIPDIYLNIYNRKLAEQNRGLI